MKFSKKDAGKRKSWWWLLLFVMIVVVVGLFVYLSRFNYLPDWYRQEQQRTAEVAVIDSLAKQFEPPAALNEIRQQPAKKLNRADVRQLVKKLDETDRRADGFRISDEMLSAMAKTFAHQNLPPNETDYINAIRSTITPEGVSVETVLNYSQIPWQKLPKRLQTLESFLEKMVGSDQSEIYLKCAGIPVISENMLTISKDATLTVGKVTYQISDLLALPFVRKQTTGKFDINDLPYTNIELFDGEMVLR
ncbi:MAG: hypothetical protein KDH95_10480 [Calditrichaeota bacterium]|nr:hypothetical protein [Calditrichota bacterium]MCB0268580.1 hypothetical protein [Calditrichota bacterium]MCB9070538.1 hypothetical protein [Calditrichia bacterium]